MPDLREVFEMVKQQTEPDLDSWVEQERRVRQAQRNRKLGAFALVAAIVVAAFVFVVGPWGDDRPAVPAEDVDPSPDGGGVAPVLGFARYDIATGEMTGIGIRASSSAVDVSPDGTRIAYVDSPSGTGDTVHIANIDGSDVQAFERTSLAGDAKAPRWSPDGARIVFQGKRGLQIGDLYVLDVTTGGVERITDLEPMTAGLWWMAPTFSSDGQAVYFNKARIAGIGGRDIGQHWDIWSVPASGGEATLIRRDAFMADVSPTGDAIAYVGARSGDGGFETADLYVARLDGTDAQKIADGPAVEFPRWSPDGSQIAYSADSDGIHIVDVGSGEDQLLEGISGWPEWVDADTLMIEVGEA
jgi:Tol biopolymer transport system component